MHLEKQNEASRREQPLQAPTAMNFKFGMTTAGAALLHGIKKGHLSVMRINQIPGLRMQQSCY